MTGQYFYRVHFNYQSQHINFAEWVSLITLCLTPLIAHVLVGTPQPVYLHHSRPRWHERIVHFNPTAIIWRYLTIADRRLRARNWNSIDMAAGNALFWTDHGWDGSEEMMVRSRALCIQRPPSTTQRVFSVDTLKTVVISLQGAQAIYLLAGRSVGTLTAGTGFAMDTVFMPVAIVGLLRLFAALWLTDDRLFKSDDTVDETTITRTTMREVVHRDEQEMHLLSRKPVPQTTIQPVEPRYNTMAHFHPPLSPPGLLVRITYISFLVFCLGICLGLMYAKLRGELSVTTLFMGYFYTTFLIVTIATYITCFVKYRHRSSSTVIPCITHIWFKVWTGFVVVGLFVLFLFAALETRRMPCGKYTTFDERRDGISCPGVSWEGKAGLT